MYKKDFGNITTRVQIQNLLLNTYGIKSFGNRNSKAVGGRITAVDGKNYNTQFYNYKLYAIISVGYRVNSERATQFRQWATNILRNFNKELGGKINE